MKPSKTLRPDQRGVALIASLIIMVIMTIIALSAMRGTALFEKVAGNTREKQRAFQVAQDALRYGEWWLNTSNATSLAAGTCPTSNYATLRVCLTPLTGVPATTQAVYNSYVPASMTVGNNGGVVAGTGLTAGDINYSQNPGIYIALMSSTVYGSTTPLYQVTAFGYGGTSGTNGSVAIVQSLYQIGSTGGINGSTKTGVLNTGE